MRLPAVLLLWAMPFIAQAQRENYDILSFVPPAGWERELKDNDHLAFKAANAKGYCTIIIYISRTPGTNPQRAVPPLEEFQMEWNDLVKRHKGADYEKVPNQGARNGWTVLSASAKYHTATEPETLAMLTTLVGHGRVTSIVVYVSDAESYAASVNSFLNSAEPIDGTAVQKNTNTSTSATTQTTSIAAASTSPGAGANGIFGLWIGLGSHYYSSGITNAAGTGYASFTTGTKISRDLMVFFPDGTFCAVLPADGLQVSHNDMRTKYPYYWGTYTYANGAGNIIINGKSYPFGLKGTSLIYDRVEYTWHYLSQDGHRFEGTFTCEKETDRWQNEHMSAEPIITFTADGRFADHGAMWWMRHVRGYTPNDDADKNYGNGTYEIKDFTMTFKYDNGKIIQRTFINTSGDKTNPSEIRFETMILSRKVN